MDDPRQLSAILSLYAAGATIETLSRATGRGRKAIRASLKTASATIDSRRHATLDRACADALSMLRRGTSLPRAADALGVSYPAIYKAMRQRGLIHPRTPAGTDVRALMLAVRAGGPPRTIADVARIAGVSPAFAGRTMAGPHRTVESLRAEASLGTGDTK